MNNQRFENEEIDEDDIDGGPYKKGNIIKLWGNKDSMNLNSMVLTNILTSPYFKNQLTSLTTYHEVVDEIYYRANHLEPWEKGSRKLGGQTGMCGGVRGVGAGGIVSTPFCLLYKLFTLKPTRSQLRGMIDHSDSPYIRAIGFLYIRYSLPPEEFWAWFSPYLDDEEEVDAKAGSGCVMTIGEMVDRLMTKLDWFSTLFPRIPVPVQKKINAQLIEYRSAKSKNEDDDKLIAAMLQNKAEPAKSSGAAIRSRSRSTSRDRSRKRERGASDMNKRRERDDNDMNEKRERGDSSRDHRRRSRSRHNDRRHRHKDHKHRHRHHS